MGRNKYFHTRSGSCNIGKPPDRRKKIFYERVIGDNMKKYKVTSTSNLATSMHFSFNGIRKYDFEPNGSVIVTNEEDVKAFKNNKNFMVEEITGKKGE